LTADLTSILNLQINFFVKSISGKSWVWSFCVFSLISSGTIISFNNLNWTINLPTTAFLSPLFLNNSIFLVIGAFAILVKSPVKGANSNLFSPNNLACPVPFLSLLFDESTTLNAEKINAWWIIKS
jgi:hypothetical protein